ncbi:MAG: DUF3098 domain-containing protein [Candidatus Limimorpha sp.]
MAKVKKETKNGDEEKKVMPFSKENYIWVLIGIAFLVLGFLLMIGGGSSDPDVFNEDMFSFRRLTLSPILILLGFGIEFYAIMKKSKR